MLVIKGAYNRNLRRPKKDRLPLWDLAQRIYISRSTLHGEIRRGIVKRPNTFQNTDI